MGISSLEICEGCGGSGVRLDATPHAGDPPTGYIVVERCDQCETFQDDLAAAKSVCNDAKWQKGFGTCQAIGVLTKI